MLKWVIVVIGLFSSQAMAQSTCSETYDAVAFQDPAEILSAEEEKRKARLEALEALNKGKQAKVIVLKQGDVDASNGILQKIVKSRIVRPDAKFYHDIDLYQAGRREPDRDKDPKDQRGSVSAEAIANITAVAAEASTIPWNQLSESEWGLKAEELRKLGDELWFVDRAEVTEPLFLLYSQIGRAAENMNNTSPPFYASINNQTVNYYWFLAGAMAHQDPALLSKATDPDVNESIKYYKEELDGGGIKKMTLSFEEGGEWDPKDFASEYALYINGQEVIIDAGDGLHQVPPGRVDVYLERTDGSKSISDRIELDKLGDKIYFVRDVARKRMGIDFASQLMDHPNECTPDLDSDILTYLNIYAKIHPEAEVFIAVPIAGNPNNVGIWRVDRKTGLLQKVLDEGGSFALRLAVLLKVGAAVSNQLHPDFAAGSDVVAGIPIGVEFRAHFLRLMVNFGVKGTLGIGVKLEDAAPPGEEEEEEGDPIGDASLGDLKVWSDYCQANGACKDNNIIRSLSMNRTIYTGFGVVLGKNAAAGYGPRGTIQVGFTNAPHTIDITIHPGYTMKAPLKGFEGRIRPIIDAELFGGVLIPYGETKFSSPLWQAGLSLGVGTTF
jgi:hypothetical protein